MEVAAATAGLWKFASAFCPGLEKLEADFPSDSLASKAHLLRSLSSFLSSLATTMSLAAEDESVSARVGDSHVVLRHAEVSQLHELFFEEFEAQIGFLSECSATFVKQRTENEAQHSLRAEILSLTLRCCFKVLPLVDCFDEKASLMSTKVLDAILRQLCHPIELLDLLGLSALNGTRWDRDCHAPQLHTDPTLCRAAELPDFNLCSVSSCQNALGEDCRRRGQLIFAVLQVFLDEILLHLDLVSRLLHSREETSWTRNHDEIICGARELEALLESAFVHVLLSLELLPTTRAMHSSRSHTPLHNLSLPASRILLEKFSRDGVPPFYVALIVKFVTENLKNTTPLNYNQASELSRLRQSVAKKGHVVGGLDWSYCTEERLIDYNLRDGDSYSKATQSKYTLHSAFSILQHAILMYMKCSSSSQTFSDFTGSTSSEKPPCSALNHCLSEYVPLASFAENVWPDATNPLLQTKQWNDGYAEDCNCFACNITRVEDRESCNRWTTEHVQQFAVEDDLHSCQRWADLVFETNVPCLGTALVQLLSGALQCVGREILKLTWLPDTFSHEVFNSQAMPDAASHEDLDEVLHIVGQWLGWCLSQAAPFSSFQHEDQHGSANVVISHSEQASYGEGPFNAFLEHAVILFSTILRKEVRRGFPDSILGEYFHLLETFVSLLLIVEEKGPAFRRSTPKKCELQHSVQQSENLRGDPSCEESSECGGRGISGSQAHCEKNFTHQSSASNRALEEMVASFQGMLEDLSEQQRGIPDFLVSFVFKQISKWDGLNLVDMVFSGHLQNQADLQRTCIIRSTEVFWSRGLVTQMLHLVLSEPTKCSALTFLVYLLDVVVKGLLPITTLSQGCDAICWYEKIVHCLTLASQMCRSSTFVSNGEENVKKFISKLVEGSERVWEEATAAASRLVQSRASYSDSLWYDEFTVGFLNIPPARSSPKQGPLPKVDGREENISSLSSFLRQAEILRIGMDDLANSGESFISYADFAATLEKGRSFSEALSTLLTSTSSPASQYTSLTADYLLSADQEQLQRTMGASAYDGINSLQEEIPRKPEGDTNLLEERLAEGICPEHSSSPVRNGSPKRSLPMVQTWNSSSGENSPNFMHEDGDEQHPSAQLQEDLDGTVGLECRDPVASVPVIGVLSTIPTPVMAEDQTDLAATSTVPMTASDVVVRGFEKSIPATSIQQRKHCPSKTRAIIKRLLRSRSSLSRDNTTGNATRRSNRRSIERGALSIDEVAVETTSRQHPLDQVRDGCSDEGEVETMSRQHPLDRGRDGCGEDAVTEGDVNPWWSGFSNPFVEYLCGQEPANERFDDLNDFIVPKKGRNYSAWLGRRKSARRRLYHKSYFQRMRERKELLAMLGG